MAVVLGVMTVTSVDIRTDPLLVLEMTVVWIAVEVDSDDEALLATEATLEVEVEVG